MECGAHSIPEMAASADHQYFGYILFLFSSEYTRAVEAFLRIPRVLRDDTVQCRVIKRRTVMWFGVSESQRLGFGNVHAGYVQDLQFDLCKAL